MIGSDALLGRAPPRGTGRRGGRPTAPELIKKLYALEPHAVLYTPLCKVRDILARCSCVLSTNGRQLSAVVAYSRETIELTWSLAGRAEILRNLIVQVQHRLGAPSFLPVAETGRRSWSETLGLPIRGRYFRALLTGEPGRRPDPPTDFAIAEFHPERDLPAAAHLMNAAYASLRRFMSVERLREMIRADYYFASGWFFVVERRGGEAVGLAINGYDSATDEGFIDWIQVLPRYRRRGLGSLLTRESIHRLRDSKRITVSGALDAPFAVGNLYRKCGFGRERRWTILGQEPSANDRQGEPGPDSDGSA